MKLNEEVFMDFAENRPQRERFKKEYPEYVREILVFQDVHIK